MADLDLVPAKRSAARFLIEYFSPRRCDSDGVAECVRCNALALARWTLRDIELHPGEEWAVEEIYRQERAYEEETHKNS